MRRCGRRRRHIARRASQDEEVFVIIDAYRGLAEAEFVLDIADVTSAPPALSSAQVYYNVEAASFAVQIAGVDPDANVHRLEVYFKDASDAPILFENGAEFMTLSFDSELSYDAAGAFSSVLAAVNVFLAEEPTNVSLVAIDALGGVSEAFDAAVESPVVIAEGTVCDENFALNICDVGLACAEGVCTSAVPPTLNTGEVYINLSPKAVGVYVEGEDLNENESQVIMRLFDINGDRVQWVNDNGDFEDFPALSAPLTSTNVAGSFTAPASGNMPETIPFDVVSTVELQIADDTGLLSNAISVVAQGVSLVADGESCDVYQGLNICPIDEACVLYVNSNASCTAVGSSCSASYNAQNLSAASTEEGRWEQSGDTTGADFIAGAGSCGGGGPQGFHTFTASIAGRYAFEVQTATGEGDTVLIARRTCGSPQLSEELACNDNIDLAAGELLSRVSLYLSEGEEISLIIDGYVNSALDINGFAASYTLVAMLEAP